MRILPVGPPVLSGAAVVATFVCLRLVVGGRCRRQRRSASQASSLCGRLRGLCRRHRAVIIRWRSRTHQHEQARLGGRRNDAWFVALDLSGADQWPSRLSRAYLYLDMCLELADDLPLPSPHAPTCLELRRRRRVRSAPRSAPLTTGAQVAQLHRSVRPARPHCARRCLATCSPGRTRTVDRARSSLPLRRPSLSPAFAARPPRLHQARPSTPGASPRLEHPRSPARPGTGTCRPGVVSLIEKPQERSRSTSPSIARSLRSSEDQAGRRVPNPAVGSEQPRTSHTGGDAMTASQLAPRFRFPRRRPPSPMIASRTSSPIWSRSWICQ